MTAKCGFRASGHEHNQDVQNAKCDHRHREEIDGDELIRVVAQKRSPRLRGRPAFALGRYFRIVAAQTMVALTYSLRCRAAELG